MQVLTLCGSLRAQSSNRAILRAYAQLAPADVRFEHYDGLARLPHFDPDLDREPPPPAVAELRAAVAAADAVVISTPEYAHALPGSFKNALDWLVSDPAFAGKRIVILHAWRDSAWALDSLREVLRTMSAAVDDGASLQLPLGTNRIDADQILARPELRAMLERSMAGLVAGFQRQP